jgi:hypothetical protein
MPKISSLKRRLANSSHNARKTNSVQPSRPKSIEVTHELSLQLHLWKEGFAEDIHMYKKRGRHDIEAEPANNEEQFASQFFNFMRKHPELVISQVSVPQIKLEVGTATPQVVPAPSSAGSAPDNQKYPMDDINEPTPSTLLYVKGRMLRTIKVANAIVVATRIMHGWPILSECAVVEVTTIREGREFDDLDYPDKEEGIVKLKDAKGNFILWPRKDIIIKTCSSPIVSP